MRNSHPDLRPTRPRDRALPPGWLVAAVALAPLLLASCADELATKCPPLQRPVTGRRSGMRLIVVAAATTLLVAAGCGDQNACQGVPPGVGAAVTDVQASDDPCAGQPANHIVAWFTRQGSRYPLRCGRRDPRGFGYVHIRYDEGGHGDPVNDATFRGEVANTLEHGIEHLASGGTWRYTVKYNDAKAICFNARYFRVVLARSPNEPDGHPTGIITALFYANQPAQYP